METVKEPTELYITRPSDKRLPSELSVYDILERLGIEYARTDHHPAATMEDCAAVSRRLGVNMCKNLFLCNRQKTSYYLLLMPADKEFRTKVLSKQINSARLSFAGADDMKSILGLTPGSATVMGLMNDKENLVRLLIDSDVMKEEYFGFHPCINTSSIRISTSDLLNKLIPALGHQPTVVEL